MLISYHQGSTLKIITALMTMDINSDNKIQFKFSVCLMSKFKINLSTITTIILFALPFENLYRSRQQTDIILYKENMIDLSNCI